MDPRNVQEQALAYVRRLSTESASDSSAKADDLLLFLYRVRDAGTPVAGLEQVLHDLEADPDVVFRSPDRLGAVKDVLRRIARPSPR